MMKLLPSLASLAFPVVAFAAGLDLTWNDCFPTGTNSKSFECTAATDQSYVLVFQFKSPVSLAAAAAMTGFMDLETDQGSVPLAPFWNYSSGGCQRPAVGVQGLSISDDISVLPECSAHFADIWDQTGSGSDEIGAVVADDPVIGIGRERFILIEPERPASRSGQV